MKLHKSTLPDYFTIASPHNSHYPDATNTFDFVERNSDVLTVTCGDSWSWGGCMTPEPNEEIRLTHNYGNLVSAELDTDWLNLSQSGSNNFFIAERIEELGKIIPALNYKKIYLICVFTEIGRSFDSNHDVYIDYLDWFKNNIDNESDFDKFLYFLNAECLKRIQQVVEKYNIVLRVGSNFVYPLAIEQANGYLKTPWFRLLGIDCPVISYTGSTGVSQLKKMEQFIPDAKKSLFKSWFSDLVDKAKYTDKVTGSLNRLHPDANQHKLWADYILQSFL